MKHRRFLRLLLSLTSPRHFRDQHWYCLRLVYFEWFLATVHARFPLWLSLGVLFDVLGCFRDHSKLVILIHASFIRKLLPVLSKLFLTILPSLCPSIWPASRLLSAWLAAKGRRWRSTLKEFDSKRRLVLCARFAHQSRLPWYVANTRLVLISLPTFLLLI